VRSARFGLPVVFTQHARRRMAERSMSESLVLDIIESGTVAKASEVHLWIYKHFADRNDNLLCVAAVVENVLVVKTVMHHWEPAA
jgi:hypothetical protein